jgi:ABC-type multidrug transport system fused ATPase/permease subunit
MGFRLVLQILLRCLPLLRGVWSSLAALLLGWAVAAAIGIALGAVLMIVWWNSVLGDDPLSPWQAALLGLEPLGAAEPERLDAASRSAVAASLSLRVIALALPLAVAVSGLYYFQVWILQRINQTLRVRLVDRLQALSLRFHAESRVGDAIYRVYQDTSTVTQLIYVLFLVPLFSSGRFLGGIGAVALFDPWIGLLLAVVWPPTLLFGLWISRRLRVGFRVARETNSALTSRIQESLSGIKVIKAYGLEAFEQQRFERDSLSAFAAAFSARNLLAVFGVGIYWIVAVIGLVALALSTSESRDGNRLFAYGMVAGFTVWTLGTYNSFKFLFGQGTGAVEQIYRFWGRAQDIAIGLDRVFELLDLEPEVQDAPDAVPLPGFEKSILFDDVSFGYQADRPVLDGIRLEAQAGTVSAIVGPTGAGKSTLMALLLRLFDPQRGRILIDGRDIRDFTLESLRGSISIALQENILFGTTVRENIRYAVPDASDERVREAARIACASEFIEELPEGFDTLLGERGAKLSTGQRQRLSIARAVLKDTPILILDEPTASLDAETELRLLRNLHEWGRERVIFMITHRLSAIRRTDKVVYLEAGRLVEAGAHEELMGRPDGAYRRLVEAEEAALFDGSGAAL